MGDLLLVGVGFLRKLDSDAGAIFAIGTGYPIYLRDHYKGKRKAPMVEAARYVSSALV